MGKPKALLPWKGKTLLNHQVLALLDGGATQVVVVLGHQPDNLISALKTISESRQTISWTINPDYANGKTTSIKAGIFALSTLPNLKPTDLSAILILNVDQPRSSGTICKVLSRHLEGPALITIPTYVGKGGHPIVFDPSLLSELECIEEESLGIKAVVQSHLQDTHRFETSISEVLLDINTPDEYQQALASGA